LFGKAEGSGTQIGDFKMIDVLVPEGKFRESQENEDLKARIKHLQ